MRLRRSRVFWLSMVYLGMVGLVLALPRFSDSNSRQAVAELSNLLRTTRLHAVETGEDQQILLPPPGSRLDLEIRSRSGSRIEHHSLPDLVLKRGPAWIVLTSTGELRLPAWHRRVLPPPSGWADPEPAADLDLVTPGGRWWIFLDEPSGRMRQRFLLAE